MGCHPNGIEFTIAGTLLLMKDRGHEIHYMTIANGSWGSATMRREETSQTRRNEAHVAAELLGACYHESIVDDFDVYYDRKTLMRLCATIREADPDITLSQSPSDYMEDHRNAVRLVYTAAICKCMSNEPVDLPTPATFKDVAVYHATPHGSRDILRKVVRSERYADIASVGDRKAAMLVCHVSQGARMTRRKGTARILNQCAKTPRSWANSPNAINTRKAGGVTAIRGSRRPISISSATSPGSSRITRNGSTLDLIRTK